MSEDLAGIPAQQLTTRELLGRQLGELAQQIARVARTIRQLEGTRQQPPVRVDWALETIRTWAAGLRDPGPGPHGRRPPRPPTKASDTASVPLTSEGSS